MNHDELDASRGRLSGAFADDGFVALEGFYDPKEIFEINAEVNQFTAVIVPTLPREQVYLENKDDPTSIKQIQKLHEHDPFFRALMEEGPVRRLAEIVLDGPVTCRNMQFFNKPAGVGQPTPPHQDGYYFHLQPCLAATAWLALEPVDEETGCIHYVRGLAQGGGLPPARADRHPRLLAGDPRLRDGGRRGPTTSVFRRSPARC